MQNFSISLREFLASPWRNRRLIQTLVVREVLGRYRGSALGILWSFFHPVFMLSVYTFIFSVVFKARWPGGSESKTEFALILFAGLLVFNLFAECISRAPGLILANVNYVKKVIFPLEILSWVSVGSALFHIFISFGVWLIFYLIFFGMPKPTLLLFPLVLLPLLLFSLGLSWFLASLGVYLRDVGQIVGLVITGLMFMSPIFYPVSALPEGFRILFHLNPLAAVIEQTREVLIWGIFPKVTVLLIELLLSSLFAWLGFAWFQKTRKGFADVV